MRPARPTAFCPLPTLLAASLAVFAASAAPLEFNRDIRPILSENCFQCHGQDAARREGKLRLDEAESALRDRDGYAAIVPGKPQESELVQRIDSADPDEVMPPPDSHKQLTAAQRELLRRWIAEGATFQKHWAFLPPRRAPLPKVRDAGWARAPLDRWVLARLEREGLAPSKEATPEAWLRRVSFDLTGLPPDTEELDRFAADVAQRAGAAYDAAVDRLLASPHYGERQALEWLDPARYADTHGFNNDSARTMWRWRDWVIDAFNANLPYDRFISEQLAGDLLSSPTLEQRIATGFGRNHVISSEGGIIGEEYRVEYVADRVRTLSTAWLGLTFECARCHDHKFDPVLQRDYYRLFAFFNNVAEHGEDGRVANAVPMIPAPTRAQQAQLEALRKAIAALDARLRALPSGSDRDADTRATEIYDRARADRDAAAGFRRGIAAFDAAGATTVPGARLDFGAKDGASLAFWLKPSDRNPRDVPLFSTLNHVGNPEDSQFGKGREVRLIDGEIEVRFSDRFPVYATVVRSEGAAIRPGGWRHVALSYAGGKRASALRLWIDGDEVPLRVAYDGQQAEPPKKDFLVGADNAPDGARWAGDFREVRGFTAAIDTAVVQTEILATAMELSPELGRRLAARRGVGTEALTRTRAALESDRAWLWEDLLAQQRRLPTAMVMEETAPARAAFVLKRGLYDAPGEPVGPGVPDTLIAAWPAGAPRNRLGLAQWLTQAQHPLTARVVVNRLWAQLFGTGLVKTLEDFGSQGEWPSHPELLDALARDFVDGGWDVKALLKSIVLSATYRQDSATASALSARDPENRLLARGPRFRLPAELIRDQALAVSGLLARKVGGPGVFPYQPEKLYDGIVVGADYPGTKWTTGAGEDLYRRSLYTFWKRTVPHPAMIAFDAPDREFCTVRRSRTNTPLQALVLWNEPGLLEAARHLGARMLREGGADDAARVAWAFRTVTGRRVGVEESRVLRTALGRLRTDFAAHPAEAAALLDVGASPIEAAFPAPDSAAAMSLASMLLSLDETITKQ